MCKSFKESPLPESKEELARKFVQFFCTSEGFGKYDIQDFTPPYLSQFTVSSVSWWTRGNCLEVTIQVLHVRSYINPTVECTSIDTIYCKIVSLSIESGEIKDAFEHAVITPLLKKRNFNIFYKKTIALSQDYPSYQKLLKRLSQNSRVNMSPTLI